jgi:choline kinase
MSLTVTAATSTEHRLSSGRRTLAAKAGLMIVEVVILAAGLGSRLGRPYPKPLTPLSSGQSIMRRQIENLRARLGKSIRITAVVGFKLEQILEANPDIGFVYNEAYDVTNTAASLRKALVLTGDAGILWLNGDVVFDAALLDELRPYLLQDQSFVCVNADSVGEEEVKYTLTPERFIRELSKTVADGLGEAVGINYVSSGDKAIVIEGLSKCGKRDYFERGLEIAIEEHGLNLVPIDISEYVCVEVDLESDLERVNALLR